MKLHLIKLLVAAKESEENIPFHDFSYFYGQMGAGKSSIARLIDYCLGGSLEYTPALQSEFVSATLHLTINNYELSLERQAYSTQVRAQWMKGRESYDVILPARVAAGEVIPNTGVEVLSDLLFHLSKVRPPKVRRSKTRDDSELSRLSIRDLMWYCYLDQDTMDSSFFNLDAEAHPQKRNKSRDVMRFVIGYHQERVAELEGRLEDVRSERMRLQAGAQALKEALESAGIESNLSMQERLTRLDEEVGSTQEQLRTMRRDVENLRGHAVDQLRRKGREIAAELESIEDAISAVETVIGDDQRHVNELKTLKVKFRRTLAAQAVLKGVEFEVCPRCAQALPIRPHAQCRICGQPDRDAPVSDLDLDVTDRDAVARVEELEDSIGRHKAQLRNLRQRLGELQRAKGEVDAELNAAMRQYDSAYLSTALTLEHRLAALEQEKSELERLKLLPQKVQEQLTQADELAKDEAQIRRELMEARAEAEHDTSNLRRLADLFLDCLVRAKIPGFMEEDKVVISPSNFLPLVFAPETGDVVVTSFDTLGSGGKKTMFKSCFALAIHRLAVEVKALLPTLLIIDSPMKNISERENREQFIGFHRLLYDLAVTELKGTQFILIDKEFWAPSDELEFDFQSRHMKPDSKKDWPLISYYRGH